MCVLKQGTIRAGANSPIRIRLAVTRNRRLPMAHPLGKFFIRHCLDPLVHGRRKNLVRPGCVEERLSNSTSLGRHRLRTLVPLELGFVDPAQGNDLRINPGCRIDCLLRIREFENSRIRVACLRDRIDRSICRSRDPRAHVPGSHGGGAGPAEAFTLARMEGPYCTG